MYSPGCTGLRAVLSVPLATLMAAAGPAPVPLAVKRLGEDGARGIVNGAAASSEIRRVLFRSGLRAVLSVPLATLMAAAGPAPVPLAVKRLGEDGARGIVNGAAD